MPALDFDAERLKATCERLGARMVVLFGSHASGSPPPRPESDVDIAVLLPRASARTVWECMEALGAAFPGRPIDLVLLPTDDPLLRWEIMRDGILLYGSTDAFLEYRAFAYRDFVDSEDLRALERRISERKLERVRTLLRAPS